MSEKICDHKSVGMFVWDDDKLLLIERGKVPFGFAVPAGHVDDDASFEDAAKRELKEEVGLDATSLELVLDEKKNNHCRREGGTWHHWKVYKSEVSGKLVPNKDETKQAGWFSLDQLKSLAQKTERFLREEIPENEWKNAPGLEPVMYEIFKDIGIL